jgi:HEAT repeat protein
VLLVLLGGRAAGQRDKAGPGPVVSGKPVAEWVKALQGKEVGPRLQAIVALRQAGPEAKPAAAALVGVFRDAKAPFLHGLAALTLARIGPAALPALEKALGDGAVTVRSGAALALGLMGPAGRPATAALAGRLKDADPLVRTVAAQALGRIGPSARAAAPALRACLADKDAAVRVNAAAALWQAAGEPRGVGVLADALAGPEAETAAGVLGDMGPAAKDAVAALKAAASDKRVGVRTAAAVALYRVGKRAEIPLGVLGALSRAKEEDDRLRAVAALGALAGEPKAVAILVRLLKDPDPATRREAACALAGRGAAVGKAVGALGAGLHDADPGVRWWCALALAASEAPLSKAAEEEVCRTFRAARFRLGDREPGKAVHEVRASAEGRAVPALAAVLRGRPARLRAEAARALAALGFEPAAAQAALVEALKADDGAVRRAAARALAGVGPAALADLVRLLGNPDGRVRGAAARALGLMGLPARSSVGSLLRVLKDPDSTVRSQAALALWRLDGNAQAALPQLRLVLIDVDNKDRQEAVEGLGVVWVEATPRIRELSELVGKALKDRDGRVRAEAARWLYRRERQPRFVVPLLRDGLTDRDVRVRLATVEVLGELSADSRAAALLLAALEDRDAGVRLAAEEALARGGAAAVPEMLAALKGRKAKVRLGVVRALALMGPEAKGAVAALEALKGDGDAAVARAAAEALRAVRPAPPR